MKMKMRAYQSDAVNAFFRDARKYPLQSQLLALPTGAGKSVIIASICEQAASKGVRVLVLARSKELLLQNHERHCQVTGNPTPPQTGLFCAGLGVRDTKQPVIFASVQSAAACPDTFGPRQLVVVDEAHQVPMEEGSQYQQVLRCLHGLDSRVKVLGLTASPYRLDGGVIFGGSDTQFDRLSYNCPLGTLFDGGYLTRPVTLPVTPVDLSGVSVQGGEYNQAEMQTAFLAESVTLDIVKAANEVRAKSALVFASGVAHAELIKAELEMLGEKAAVVTGGTLPLMRETALTNFDSGTIRWLVNVNVLTTGYDCPRIDMIVLARGTKSPGLFYQMVGRGFRLFKDKTECHVVDYGGNIKLHGAIDSPRFGIDTIKPPGSLPGEPPKRVCPSCFEVQHAALRVCVECGLEFPVKEGEEVKPLASKESITVVAKTHKVERVDYQWWNGKDGKPDTLMVQYILERSDDHSLDNPSPRQVREWVCIQHADGTWPRAKAVQWWNARTTEECPETLDEALHLIDAGALTAPTQITVKKDGRFDKITNCVLGPKTCVNWDDVNKEIPF